MRDLEEIPLRKLVDLALASDRMTAGRYLHEIKRRLPMFEAAVAGMEAAHNHFLKDGTSSLNRFTYAPWAAALVAYRAARDARRGDAVD